MSILLLKSLQLSLCKFDIYVSDGRFYFQLSVTADSVGDVGFTHILVAVDSVIVDFSAKRAAYVADIVCYGYILCKTALNLTIQNTNNTTDMIYF